MRNAGFLWIIIAIMVSLDFYVFQAIKVVCQGSSPKLKTFVYSSYWFISLAAVIILALLPLLHFDSWPRSLRNYLFATILGLFFAKLIASVFFLVDDLRRVIQWAAGKLLFRNTEGENLSGEGVTRSVFLSWLGLGIGGSLFGTLVYGFSNKYNYQV
ncbi:MAG TPA: metallophosphoesterase, partial [Puia sp.]|nr:metallophosphoesterase [Puia sp.]